MFDRTNAAPAPNATNSGIPDNKKAVGFLNFYLPNQAGTGRRKLGYIPLRAGNVSEAAIAKWLVEDPTRISIILAKLDIEFNLAEVAEGNGFDLSDDRTAPPADNIPG